MKRLFKSKLILTLVVLVMLTAAIAIPLSGHIVHAHAAKPTSTNVFLTSITLDPEDANGQTTDAPGAWSTNPADPLIQVGVRSKGKFLNQPIGTATGSLGEISIQLQSGINTFTLYGNQTHPENLYYGAILFFDHQATPPQIAVYNPNGGTGAVCNFPSSKGAFCVQPARTSIIGSANGGLFFDVAPGTSIYTAPDGTTVAVKNFTINSLSSSTTDLVSPFFVGANGVPDTVATLQLDVTPPQ